MELGELKSLVNQLIDEYGEDHYIGFKLENHEGIRFYKLEGATMNGFEGLNLHNLPPDQNDDN